MIYVVSEYAKIKDDVVTNVECFDNEIRAKNYLVSRIDEFKSEFYITQEITCEDYGYLNSNKSEYWIKLFKREMK